MRSWSRLAWIGLLLVAALFALRFRNHTCDDAYISFRYARNFVEGNGLVFNPGERVEGYTNFLWVLLSAAPLATGHDPARFARVLGLAATLASLAGVLRAAERLTSRRPLAYAGALLFALSPPVAVWATAGLETPLFTALVTWGVWLAVEGIGRGRLPAGAALLLAAATLTRPEGLLVTAAVMVAAARARPGQEIRLRGWPGFAATIGVVLVPWLLWRTAYYGDLLPNTFHAKVGFGGAQIGRGLIYLLAFVAGSGSWILASLALGATLARRRVEVRVLLAVILPYLAYVVAVGGDFMPMDRFFVPILGLLTLLLIAGAEALVERRPNASARGAWAATAVLVAWAAACTWPAFAGGSFDYVQQDRREVATWRQIGRWFRTHAAPGESIALVPAGAIPYYSRLVTIDMLGLNDRTIAHSAVSAPGSAPAGHEKSDADYVLARRPTYVLLGTYTLSETPPDAASVLPLYYRAEREITAATEFKQNYRMRFGRCPGGYFTFFARNGAAPAR